MFRTWIDIGIEMQRRIQRSVGRLTARQVTTAEPRGDRNAVLLPDGANLYLQVVRTKTGDVTRSWVFRYELNGKRHDMGLGPLRDFGLAEARDRARELRQKLHDGIDPLDAKREQKREQLAKQAAQVKLITFRECAQQCIAAHEKTWTNEKHRWQWRTTLEQHAYPVIGDLAVSDIDTAHVVKVLEPIWHRIPETASRLRTRVEKVLGWATVRGYRSGDNPARWRGHLAELLPARRKIQQVKHLAALPYAELPAFMDEVRSRDSTVARAFEFTALTAARTGEVIGATWSEIDFKSKTWTIPAARMKSRREHRVPLSDRAVTVLKGLPHHGAHLFTSAVDRALSDRAMLDLMDSLRPGYVPHGLRSTFRDWAAETTAFPNHVVEMALAHSIGNVVEKAYRRGDLFEKRRNLMQAWSDYCARPETLTGATVTPLREAKPS
jgi:integrase